MCLIVWLSAANSKIVIASKCFVGFWITHTVSFVVVLLRVFYYFCYSRQTAPAADSKNSCRRRWRRDEDRWRFLFYDRGWYKWVYCTAEEKEGEVLSLKWCGCSNPSTVHPSLSPPPFLHPFLPLQRSSPQLRHKLLLPYKDYFSCRKAQLWQTVLSSVRWRSHK